MGLKERLIQLSSFINQSKKKSPFLRSIFQIILSFIFLVEKQIRLLREWLKFGKLYFKNTYWIDTEKIQYLSELKSKKWRDIYRIIGGDWDKCNRRFEDLILYQAFKQKFIEGKKWEDTEYYRTGLENILKGLDKWGYNDKGDLDRRIKFIEDLFYKIKTKGFKSKRELISTKNWISRLDIHKLLDNIAVDIGRNGQLLIRHGKNRLSIAKVLNISEIPVTIIARHKEWMYFRRNLRKYFKVYQNRKKVQILKHPDLQNIPYKQGENFFDIIRKNISIFKGTLLEMEAQLGFFSIKFEDDGFECYAQESNPVYLKLLKKLKTAENKKFNIIAESIYDYIKAHKVDFDIIIAINFLNNYLKNKENFHDLINFFKNVKVKEFFIEIPNQKKVRKAKAFRNYDTNRLIDIIIENSCLNKATLLSKTNYKSYVYKLTANNFSP